MPYSMHMSPRTSALSMAMMSSRMMTSSCMHEQKIMNNCIIFLPHVFDNSLLMNEENKKDAILD
jgi:hypothetical protein